MARFSLRDRFWPLFVVKVIALATVEFTLGINLLSGYPIASLAAALAIAGGLWWTWVRAGRPGGVSQIEAIAEGEL